jgi:ubiquinone/menaquinone biosynthesis C-methylase UbiE
VITVDFNRLPIRPGARILDIGCGSGRHTAAAYRLRGAIVTGADLNPQDLNAARERLRFHDRLGEHGGGCWNLALTTITDLPFSDASFDLVICSEVLEHIPDHQKAIREVVRVLKPGMPLVVSVPRFFPERICWTLSKDYAHANQGHVRIYRKKALIGLLERAGTGFKRYHHAHSIHTPFSWLKCLVGPTRTDSSLVNHYHRLLVWDIMKKPWVTRFVDRLLNPLMGKSLVVVMEKMKNSDKKG